MKKRALEPTVYRPHGALTSFVEYFWTLECGRGDTILTLKTFANGVSGIIVQHHNGRSALSPTTAQGHPVSTGDVPTSFVYGKRTRPSQTFAKGPFGLTGVVFKPQGLSALLNTHPIELNNGPVELDEFSRENVGEQLLNARSQHERVARLTEFLRGHLDGSRPVDLLVAESLRLIHQGIRSIRVPQLLKSLNVLERQFERRFVRAIGVSPHHYIRIVRFQEAVRLIKTNQFERLSDVAYDLNYVDQSHFIKDIKQFSGYTPTSLVQTVQTSIDLPCALILAPTQRPSADGDNGLGQATREGPAALSSLRVAAPAHAQFVVIDPANLVQTTLIAYRVQQHYTELRAQYLTVLRMAQRLGSLDRFRTPPIALTSHDPSRWDFGRPWIQALNSGDPAGSAYLSTALPLLRPTTTPPTLSAAARQMLQRQYATVEITDSVAMMGGQATHSASFDTR
jgi:AraC-like DNA-binding protein